MPHVRNPLCVRAHSHKYSRWVVGLYPVRLSECEEMISLVSSLCNPMDGISRAAIETQTLIQRTSSNTTTPSSLIMRFTSEETPMLLGRAMHFTIERGYGSLDFIAWWSALLSSRSSSLALLQRLGQRSRTLGLGGGTLRRGFHSPLSLHTMQTPSLFKLQPFPTMRDITLYISLDTDIGPRFQKTELHGSSFNGQRSAADFFYILDYFIQVDSEATITNYNRLKIIVDWPVPS
ncbi:hypothetical protein BJV77DRAFT_146905 [Russula vinacea]|nr:hypothetical protein BJV77DRAFT_146905 [Russula vinacea]